MVERPGGFLGGAELWEPYSSAPRYRFAHDPVPLDKFVQHRSFLGNPPLSPIQYHAVRHAERVYMPGTYEWLADNAEKETREYWDPERFPVRMVNFLTLQWGKGCKIAGMEVYDAQTGLWETVESASAPGVVACMWPGQPPGFAERSAFFKVGAGPCLEVRTRSGYETTVHRHHQFLTREPESEPFWRCLSQMSEGDWVATSRSLPEPQTTLAADPREVELVGLWLGDGNMPRYTYKTGPALKDGTRRKYKSLSQLRMYADHGATAEMARYRELCESFEGVRLRAQDTGTKWLLTATNNYAHANPVTEVARRWGLYGKTFRDKRVPPLFMGLPRAHVALLLSRLIDTDGSVYFEKTGQPRIEFTSASPGLVLDVRRLMLRLGARATVRERSTRCQQPGCEGHLSQRLVVTDVQSLAALAGELTLLDKQPRLDAVKVWLADRDIPAEHIYWDRIKSLRDAGTHEFYDTEVTGSGPEWPSEMVVTEPTPGPHNYLSTGFLDHNGGKDHICRIISLRIAHLLLCLEDPQEYYQMPSQDTIHLLNVASSSKQASRAFFAPMRRAVTRPGNWFEHSGVEVVEIARGPRREPTTQALQDTIRFDKHIEAISGHSDAETQEGLNLIVGIADEIDAFKRRDEFIRSSSERESSRSAEGIIEMLRTSARTRFPLVFKNVYISWPRYKGSMIQVLTDTARRDYAANGEASEEYASGPHSTWVVNPRVQRRCPSHATFQAECAECFAESKKSFAKDYKDDPVMSAAKYECRPARAMNPFFSNLKVIEDCLVDGPVPLAVGYEVKGSAWQPAYEFGPSLTPVAGAVYAMHADLAISGDRAGIAMAHVARWEEVEVLAAGPNGEELPVLEHRPIVRVDFVVSYSAATGAVPPREIQIRWARLLALELRRRHFNIRRMTFDQFQSADSMQILTTHGIESERLSTDLTAEHWRSLRDLFSEDRLRIPRPVPSDEQPTVIDELLALTRLPNGRIDHPPGGSKDEADALAGAVAGALLLGGSEELDKDGQPVAANLASGHVFWGGIPDGSLPIGFESPFGAGFHDAPARPQALDGLGFPMGGGAGDGWLSEEADGSGWEHEGQG